MSRRLSLVEQEVALLGRGACSLTLTLGGPMTAHTLASAVYRVGIPLRQAIRDDLAHATTSSHPSVEENRD